MKGKPRIYKKDRFWCVCIPGVGEGRVSYSWDVTLRFLIAWMIYGEK